MPNNNDSHFYPSNFIKRIHLPPAKVQTRLWTFTLTLYPTTMQTFTNKSTQIGSSHACTSTQPVQPSSSMMERTPFELSNTAPAVYRRDREKERERQIQSTKLGLDITWMWLAQKPVLGMAAIHWQWALWGSKRSWSHYHMGLWDWFSL